MVSLSFLFTSYISLREMLSYRRTGTMPNDTAYDPALAEYSNEAFSTNPFNDNAALEPEDGPAPLQHYRTNSIGGETPQPYNTGPYEAVNQTEMDEYRHAGRHEPSPYGNNDYNDYNARSLSSRTGTTPQPPAPYTNDPFVSSTISPAPGSQIPPVDTSYNGAFTQQMEEEFHPGGGRYQY